jgi:hypothetical protein
LQKVTVAYVAPVATFFASLPVPREDAVQAVRERETELDARGFKPSDFVDASFLREIEESGFLRPIGAR